MKKNKRKNQIPMPRVGPPGPPGPRGPPGPAGEAGGVLTTGEMEAYITDFLRGKVGGSVPCWLSPLFAGILP